MTAVYKIILAGLIAGITALAGCGGGGGGTNVAGIGGTGKTISGTITGFGSIFVNGVEYDVDNASFNINNDNSPGLGQADLRIGMVVILTGSDDGTVGTATQVLSMTTKSRARSAVLYPAPVERQSRLRYLV